MKAQKKKIISLEYRFNFHTNNAVLQNENKFDSKSEMIYKSKCYDHDVNAFTIETHSFVHVNMMMMMMMHVKQQYINVFLLMTI